MPAAKKPKWPKPAEIKSSHDAGKPVVVERLDAEHVKITWVCGATRTFSPDDLREAISTFEMLATYGDGVPLWMDNRDSTGVRYCVRLSEGRMHGDDSTGARESYSVPWATFKKALVARSK